MTSIQRGIAEFFASLIIISLLVGGWIWRENTVYKHGYDAAVTERKASDNKQLATDTAKAHDSEAKLESKLYNEAIARTKERNDYENTIESLRKSARAGTSGMRCPGAAVSSDPARTDSTAASGPGAETGYALMPSASDGILSAASDLRNNVRQINALIDAYDAARATCNAQ